MRKVVVFVEGQAEQIFVRELLLRYYDYNNVCIRCYQLVAEKTLSAKYDFGDESSDNLYQIINVGGDNKVLSAMIVRSQRMLDSGFNLVIGLRDMYSKVYREVSPGEVSLDLNIEFVESAKHAINQHYTDDRVQIHFAVMEIETWMLALIECWKRDITDEKIEEYIYPNCDLEKIYHPTEVMKAITSSTGDAYDKHSGQVNAIVANITKDDYLNLFASNQCPSFNEFIKDLLGI